MIADRRFLPRTPHGTFGEDCGIADAQWMEWWKKRNWKLETGGRAENGLPQGTHGTQRKMPENMRERRLTRPEAAYHPLRRPQTGAAHFPKSSGLARSFSRRHTTPASCFKERIPDTLIQRLHTRPPVAHFSISQDRPLAKLDDIQLIIALSIVLTHYLNERGDNQKPLNHLFA
jgi:hypothetical protein